MSRRRDVTTAAVGGALGFALVELVATLWAAPHRPPPHVVGRLVVLVLGLAAVLGLLIAAAVALVRLAARTGRALGDRHPPGPMARRVLAGAAALGFVAAAWGLGAALLAAYKDRTLAALVAAVLEVGLLAAVVAVAWALVPALRPRGRPAPRWLAAALAAGLFVAAEAALLARVAPPLAALGALGLGGLAIALARALPGRLDRLLPGRLGSRRAALLLLVALAGGAVALAFAALPRLRPELPVRSLVALAAVVLGIELGLGRRRLAWLAPAALPLIPLALLWAGADPASKAVALSSSPPLTALIDLIRRGNDLDRDGYGSLLGENDCAPLDGDRYPLARDLPDDGIDQNCDGKDFHRGVPPSYRTGERLPVPAGFVRPWNVLLVTIDTVRYDHTTMGGYHERTGRDTTPNLAALAARSTSFAFANAPSAGTMASIPAILTSRFFHSGIALGPDRRGMPPVLKPSNVLISEVLQQAGLATGALLSHEYFNDWGMEQGFDTYDNAIGAKPDPYRVTSDRLTDRALAWIGERADRRWFLWVHYIDPHGRYVAHPGGPAWGATEEDLYDGELRYTDEHLGRLFAELGRLPGAERTVIAVTSDHGDAFGEHGFINHGQALYRELLHVPLIVHVPDLEPRVVEGPVSPLDLFPTIADLCGLPTDDLGLEGESLVPQLFHGRDARDRVVFAETNFPRPIRAVVTASHKLIFKLKDNVYELYDLRVDPGEHADLWPRGDPAAFARLKGFLDDWLERVYYARDPESNQAMVKLADVLLRERPRPANPTEGGFDDGAIKVLGWEVEPAVARPGDKLSVAVYLEVVRRPSADHRLQVESRVAPAPATGAATASSQLRAPGGGALPATRWRPGEFIRDRFQIKVPARWGRAEGGRLTLGLRFGDGTRRLVPTGATIEEDRELLRLGEVPLAPPAAPAPTGGSRPAPGP